jgi:hypothetical protein
MFDRKRSLSRKSRRILLMTPLVLGVSVAAWAASTATPVASTAKPGSADAKTALFLKNAHPILEKYCFKCHGNGESKGDVTLDKFNTAADVLKDRQLWETVLHHVTTQEMPPSDAKLFPDTAEREQLGDWIESTLYNYDPSKPDPGRVTIHRLNRSEYNNTIRDLVGVNFQPADDFPADNSGYGFDNVSDVLSLSPTLMQNYLAAANKILDEAIATDTIPSETKHFQANLMEFGFNADGDSGDGWMPLSSLEEDEVAMTIPVNGGEYTVRVQAYNKVRGAAPAKPIYLTCMIDDDITHIWPITATDIANPGVYEAQMSIPPGKHRISVSNHHLRGGAYELQMKNGRLGLGQTGTIMVKWVELQGPSPNLCVLYPAKQLEVVGEGKFNTRGERVLEHNGEVAAKITVPKDGDYILRAEAYAAQAGTDFAKMEFRIDGKVVQSFDVYAPATRIPTAGQQVFSTLLLEAQPQIYEFPIKLPAGEHRYSAAFVNELADPTCPDPNLRQRALVVNHLEVVGLNEPQALPAMPEPIKNLFIAAKAGAQTTPEAQATAARKIVADFAYKAWRRPVLPAEMDQLMTLYTAAQKDGLSYNASVKQPLKAVLVSPFFLFRGEIQPDPNNPESVHPVDEFALASRLSYFLWSSTPDEELLSLAAHNQLRKNLDAQVKRLMTSPKAQAFVENFSGQWLEIRNLKFVAPDHDTYPAFDENLRRAMMKETELFFGSVMHEDRSVLDFLNGDYTFVNEPLAKLYGMPNVSGEEFQRVSLKGTPRRGVFTQASVLTLTSNPTRTSPVKRGKWVLEELLGSPPPPPPPVVPELKNDGQPVSGTLRHQMEEHRADPVCASCHARMDPIGFGLENFDGIGRWRDAEQLVVKAPAEDPNVQNAADDAVAAPADAANAPAATPQPAAPAAAPTGPQAFPIDPSGQLVSGESFKGAAELADILATTKRDFFVRCLTEKMLTYALGRGTEYYDRDSIQKISDDLAKHQYKFSTLVLDVVNSLPFQECRGEGDHAPTP